MVSESSPLGAEGAGAGVHLFPPLHASEMRLYQACPRKWQYAYQARRVPRIEDANLSRGSQVHLYLEDWWSNRESCRLPSDPVAKACAVAYDAYWKQPPVASGPGGWCTELAFASTMSIDHYWLNIAGTVDAIDPDDPPTIVEHKTTSQDIAPGSVYWRQVVTTDVQVSMYRAAFPGAKIIYDVIRKPALKLKKSETESEYTSRCLEAISLEPEKYFQRATIVRLESEDEAFARDVVAVDRLRSGREHPRNAASCFAYGRRCEYFDVCWANASLDDDSIFKDRQP